MKRLNKLFLLLISLFIISACSNNNNQGISSQIAEQKITNNNLQTITDQIATDKDFSQENIELFINALTRLGNNKDSIVGKTVGQLIEEQRTFALSRVVETLKNSSARISLFLNHKFHYEGVRFDDADKANKINTLIFTVTNTSDKEIKKLEGVLQFFTQRGELVKMFNINTLSPIPVTTDGKGIAFAMPFTHDDKNQRDMILRTATDLNAVWTPTLIEFTDGTKIVDLVTANK